MLKSCYESSLSEDTVLANAIFLLLQVVRMSSVLSSSLKEVFLVRHAIFPRNEMNKKIKAPRGTVLFSIPSTENSILKFKMK